MGRQNLSRRGFVIKGPSLNSLIPTSYLHYPLTIFETYIIINTKMSPILLITELGTILLNNQEKQGRYDTKDKGLVTLSGVAGTPVDYSSLFDSSDVGTWFILW